MLLRRLCCAVYKKAKNISMGNCFERNYGSPLSYAGLKLRLGRKKYTSDERF